MGSFFDPIFGRVQKFVTFCEKSETRNIFWTTFWPKNDHFLTTFDPGITTIFFAKIGTRFGPKSGATFQESPISNTHFGTFWPPPTHGFWPFFGVFSTFGEKTRKSVHRDVEKNITLFRVFTNLKNMQKSVIFIFGSKPGFRPIFDPFFDPFWEIQCTVSSNSWKKRGQKRGQKGVKKPYFDPFLMTNFWIIIYDKYPDNVPCYI